MTSIGEYTFQNCTRLANVTLPSTLTSISNYAFSDCSSLTGVYISDVAAWCGIDFGSYANNNPLYYAHNLYLNGELVTDLVIPEGVTSIGENAFYNCSSLTNVTIPESVTSIGSYAFSGCSKLTTAGPIGGGYGIEFGWTKAIPQNAFKGHSGLTRVTIPDTVTSVGSNAFSGCSKLATAGPIGGGYGIEFGWTEAIPQDAFKDYTILTSVTIPEGVTSIGYGAFSGCSRLTSVTIPEGVTSIGYGAFSGCSRLTSVTIPEGVTSVGSNTFSGCSKLATAGPIGGGYNYEFGWTDSIPAYALSGCSNLTSIIIPSSVTSIGGSAFSGCSGLTGVCISDIAAWCGVDFGNNHSNPLRYAHNLYLNGELVTDLAIPEGVTSIGSYAFYNCSGLTSVTIPEGVTSIGTDAFSGCAGLTRINFDGTASQLAQVSGKDYLTATGNSSTEIYYLYAEVIFDANGGTGTMDTQVVPNDEPFQLPANGFTPPDGTALFAWSVDGQNYVPGEEVTISGDTTAAAVWKTVYTVTFDANGGSGSADDEILFEGSAYTLPDCPFTAPPYQRFLVWDIDGQKYAPGSQITMEKDVTVTAIWEPIPHTVAFSANGGDGSMDSLTLLEGATYTLPTCSFTALYGQRFRTWSVDGQEYAPGDELVILKDITMQAVWEDIPIYAITFDPNGGSGGMDSLTMFENSIYTLPECSFVNPSAQRFKAWKIDGQEHLPGDELAVVSDMTAQALWEACAHGGESTIIEERILTPWNCGNGGVKQTTSMCNTCGYLIVVEEDVPATGAHVYGATVTVTAPVGNTAGLGKKNCTECGQEVTFPLFEVRYRTTDRAPSMPTQIFEGESVLVLPTCSLTPPDGKTFLCWEIGGTRYEPGAQYTITANTTVSPVWVAAPFYFPFTADDAPDVVTAYIGQPLHGGIDSQYIPTRYTLLDEDGNVLSDTRFSTWLTTSTLDGELPTEPGTYTIRYELSAYAETTVASQVIKQPTGQSVAYSRTFILRLPRTAVSCELMQNGSLHLELLPGRFVGKGALHIASYTAEGQLLDSYIAVIPDMTEGFSDTVTPQTAPGGIYKVFLLDGESCAPLLDALGGSLVH